MADKIRPIPPMPTKAAERNHAMWNLLHQVDNKLDNVAPVARRANIRSIVSLGLVLLFGTVFLWEMYGITFATSVPSATGVVMFILKIKQLLS